ncbi:MAG: lyase family protein [Acidimicrobiales bacterium]
MSEPGFSTPGMDRLWSARRRLERIAAFEVGLARAWEAHGAPAGSASAVGAAFAAVLAAVDSEAAARGLLAEGWQAGSALLPLLERARDRLAATEPQAVAWLHRGATSQDALDTALALSLRDALRELSGELARLDELLGSLSARHGQREVLGRTLLQPAVPLRFASRIERWRRPAAELAAEAAARAGALPVQLGGPVGDGASFAGFAAQLRVALADELGLAEPGGSWHTDRRPVVSAVELAAAAARAGAQVAYDLALLAQPEIGELRLRAGRSSSMAHKRNPIDSARALAAADACRGVASVVTGARPYELERSLGAWHAEWFAAPLAFAAAAACVAAAADAVASIEL